MSILLRKRRQLVVALLGRDMGRVDTFSHVKPTSAVLLDNALTAVEEWCGRVQNALRECFEDQRIADDLTHDLADTLADLRIPRPRQPHPSLAYKSVFARVARVKAGVEKLIRELDLYTEPKHLAPLTPEESALVNLEQMRALQKAVFAVTSGRGFTAQIAPARTREPPAAVSSRAIFISHSTRDQPIAEKLVDLLTSAFDPPLARGEIMCTSVPGCTLEGGARTDDRLLEEIRAAPVFIGLITPPSVNSGYVLFELGARWAVGGLLTVPVLGPACTPDLLPGPLKGVNAHRTGKRDSVLQLVNEVANGLGRRLQPSHAWDHRVAALVDVQEPRIAIGDVLIDGPDLQRLAEDAVAYRMLLEQIDGQQDSRIVDAAVRVGELDLSLLKQHEAVKDQVQKIFDQAQRLHPDVEVRIGKIERDEEHGCDSLVFQTTMAGAPRDTRLDFDYLSGPEWGELAALYAVLADIGPGPYRVQTSRGDYEVRDIFEAVQILKKDGAVS